MARRILVLVLALCVLAPCARGDCEACVNGWCHSRKTLIQGFHVSDHMAIDHTNNILYVQINSNQNTAFFLDDLKIHLVQTLNTTGMAVNQDTNDLYTAYDTKHIYKYPMQGNNTHDDIGVNSREDIDLMFYKKYLYYTSKMSSGLNRIRDGKLKYFTYLVDYKITDFVVAKDDYVYFVANESVYEYHTSWEHAPKILAKKKYALSTDISGDVYFGDALINAIYKINESKELVEFAAYKSGSLGRFVFDNGNNIVFHDALDGNIVTWKRDLISNKCSIHEPPAKYSIKVLTDDPCTYSVAEIEEQQ